MPKFQTIKSENEIKFTHVWKDSTDFKSKGKIVEFNGNKYQLIWKKERDYTCSERLKRGILAVLAIVLTAGLAFCAKSVRSLLLRKKEILRYALLQNPETNQPYELRRVPRTTDRPLPIQGDIVTARPLPTPGGTATARPLPTHGNTATARPLPTHGGTVTARPLPIQGDNTLRDVSITTNVPSNIQNMATHPTNKANIEQPQETPKFSHIFKLDPKSPLMKSIPIDDINTEILHFSLQRYCLDYLLNIDEVRTLSNVDQKAQMAIIKERVDLLDATIQIKERFESFGDSFEIWQLQLEDVLTSWIESPLRCALLSDDEILGLKISDIKDVPGAHVEKYLCKRLLVLSEKRPAPQVHGDLSNLPIVDVCQLKAETINKNIKSLPPSVFYLISTDVIEFLKTDTFSAEQLTALCDGHLDRMNPKQINDCLGKIKTAILLDINETQYVGLDPEKIDKPIFKMLMDTKKGYIEDFFGKLPMDTINKLSKWFEKKHWQALSEEQVFKLDFSQMDKKVFDTIFKLKVGDREEWFQKLKPKDVENLSKHFDDSHWKALTKKQKKGLDLNQIADPIWKKKISEFQKSKKNKEY